MRLIIISAKSQYYQIADKFDRMPKIRNPQRFCKQSINSKNRVPDTINKKSEIFHERNHSVPDTYCTTVLYISRMYQKATNDNKSTINQWILQGVRSSGKSFRRWLTGGVCGMTGLRRRLHEEAAFGRLPPWGQAAPRPAPFVLILYGIWLSQA